MSKQIKPTSWGMRRHSYGPSHIGLTTPPEETVEQEPDSYSPRVRISVDKYTAPIDNLVNLTHDMIDVMSENNRMVGELIRLQSHTLVDTNDIDVSDSSLYTLAAGQAAMIPYVVPDNYVLLLRSYETNDAPLTTYYVYINGNLFQSGPSMDFPGAGIALAPGVRFDMYVLNLAVNDRVYRSSMRASVRREVNWEYPTYTYKIDI